MFGRNQFSHTCPANFKAKTAVERICQFLLLWLLFGLWMLSFLLWATWIWNFNFVLNLVSPYFRFSLGPSSLERVLSNNIKRQILTSLENINYLRCETRGTPIVLHAVVNILFIFASKLACQETESIYLDLICFVLRKEFENWVDYSNMQNREPENLVYSIENFFCRGLCQTRRKVKTFTFT